MGCKIGKTPVFKERIDFFWPTAHDRSAAQGGSCFGATSGCAFAAGSAYDLAMKPVRLLLALLILSLPLQAAGPYTPANGTKERKALMDGFRAWVKKQHQVEVIFVVDYLKVLDGWAWAIVSPQSKGGKDKYENLAGALKQNADGSWKLVFPDPSHEWFVEESDLDEATARKRLVKIMQKEHPSFPSVLIP